MAMTVTEQNEWTVCVHALAAILEGRWSTERAVRTALGTLATLDNEGRRRISRRIIATGILRARLAWRAQVSMADADALLRAYIAEEESVTPSCAPPWPKDPVERMAMERSAPHVLVSELIRSLGLEGADAFLAASNAPGPVTLRVNTARIDRAALCDQLNDEGVQTQFHPDVPTALNVVHHANLFGTRAWREGLFEVQDAASQIAALMCGVRPGDVVVDLCAGRGGKTLALAAALGGRGLVYAHDIDGAALRCLRPRLARAGVTCVVEGLPPVGTADVVLVDAPCSSLGPLRRSPDLRWALRPENLAPLPALQRMLLLQGAQLTRPGGLLVYATCTVRREENDDVVQAVAAEANLDIIRQRLLLPHVEGCDGFFVAVLRVPAAGHSS